MTTRFTVHSRSNASNEVNANIYNTFPEVLAYCQAVCDFTNGSNVKIIDREKKTVVYEGPMNYEVLNDLRKETDYMTYLFIGLTNYLGGFDIRHEIPWDLKEDFEALIKHKPFKLSQTSANDILSMSDLSIHDKILLSAAAGAAIQYLIDCDDSEAFGDLELAFDRDS